MIISLFLGVLIISSLILTGIYLRWLHKRFKSVARQLEETGRRIQALEETRGTEGGKFHQSLNQEEFKAKLAQGRPAFKAPDRYRHVTSLVSRGFDTEEVASILGISFQEAEQLVKLAGVSGKEASGKGK